MITKEQVWLAALQAAISGRLASDTDNAESVHDSVRMAGLAADTAVLQYETRFGKLQTEESHVQAALSQRRQP